MFAVPGWNLKAQGPVLGKERKERGTQDSQSKPEPFATSGGSKRKRGHDTEPPVNGDDLDKLWNKHVGSGTPGHQAKGKQHKKNKKQRKEELVNGVAEPSAKDAHNAEAANSNVHHRKQSHSGMAHAQPGEINGNGVQTTKSDSRSKKAFTRTGNKSTLPADNPSFSAPPPPHKVALTPLQQSMRAKLISARFRHLNEALYTTDSSRALSMFSESPELFAEYHAGFSQQVKESWPENPVDVYIDAIRKRAKIPFKLGKEGKISGLESRSVPLPRRPHGTCTIADLGCGDAPLARGLQSNMKSLNLKFYNFDLHAANSLITKADISSLPLKDGEVDIAVFCLSLMGTNWISFVEEAWRILRGDGRGEIWVAEVKSRFGRMKPQKKSAEDDRKKSKKKKQKRKADVDSDNEAADEEVFAEVDSPSTDRAAQDDTDISSFVDVFQRRGFSLRQDSVNKSNKMFVSMIFTKSGVPTAGKWKGMKWIGTRYERIGDRDGKKRYLDEDREGMSPEEESKVLKPCVYKNR